MSTTNDVAIAGDILARAATVIKCLGHPLRLRLLEALEQGERTVTELQDYADMSQAAVSQQLATLKARGIVDSRREGTFVYYRIRRIQDAGAYTNDADVNFRFLPCLVSGLSFQLSLKYAPDRAPALKALYEEDFNRAAMEDRDTASVQFVPDMGV